MTEINDVTTLTESVKRIAKALDQDFGGASLTESLDSIADYIEGNGIGGDSKDPKPIEIVINNYETEEDEWCEADKSYNDIWNEYQRAIYIQDETGPVEFDYYNKAFRIKCIVTVQDFYEGELQSISEYHGFILNTSESDSISGALVLVCRVSEGFDSNDGLVTYDVAGYEIYEQKTTHNTMVMFKEWYKE